jgi:hypothetical protein
MRSIPCVLLAACTAAQSNQPDPKQVLEEMQQSFRKEGISFDTKAQTVAVRAIVNEPRDPIEYLLIHTRGKRHEAVFVTKAKPSVLNAALLLLGLQQGKNAQVVEKNPPPSLEEVERGVDPVIIVPPSGPGFWMTVSWQTADGKKQEHCVEDLILELSTQKPLGACQWVYLGGRMARIYKDEPEVYIADFEGNLVSVCYLSPDNHLATMAHANARDDQNWWTTALLPAPGTEVEFCFHRTQPALHQERDKRLLKQAAAEREAAKSGKSDGKPGDADKK